MFDTGFPATFLSRAADVLGDTNSGLSGTNIVRAFNAYGDQWDVKVPHPTAQWDASNKRTALYDSLQAFSPQQQFQIIEELCEHRSFPTLSPEREKLRIDLFTKFDRFRGNREIKELDVPLIEETRHWLHSHPKALKIFNDAKTKYDSRIFQRSLLDDLRLSLETLLKDLLGNSKSLENQIAEVCKKLKEQGSSPQFINMIHKLLDLYCKYQNDHAKHDDNVPEQEIEFIFEITASFMK